MTEKSEFLFGILLVFLIGIISGGLVSFFVMGEIGNQFEPISDKLDKLYEKDHKCTMYNEYKQRYDNKTVANGIYWNGKDFYCVWANNRTLSEQDRTDRHEHCHYLIDNDYEHFCEGVNAQ